MVLICRLSPPPAPAVLLRSRAPLSLARHLPTLWGVILPEGAFKLKLIAKAATPQAASRPAPLEGEPGGPMTSIGPYSIGVEESRPRRGQYGEGPKSVKKNAVIPAFFSFWVLRPQLWGSQGRVAPEAGSAASQQRDFFRFLFWSQKRKALDEKPL